MGIENCVVAEQNGEARRPDPTAGSSHDGRLRLQSLVAGLADGQIRVRFLQGFLRHERQAILSTASYRHLSRDTVLSRQGEPADRLFLLVRGSARFFFLTPDGRKFYLHWLAPGEIFGGASLLEHSTTYLVNTEIAKGGHVLVWPRTVVRSLASMYPRILENALSVATDYLAWYLASHLSLVSYNARERLAHVLVTLAQGIGHKSGGGILLEATNEQLANTANITLFTASRLLSQFQRSGAISKSRGKIVVYHPERLLADAPNF